MKINFKDSRTEIRNTRKRSAEKTIKDFWMSTVVKKGCWVWMGATKDGKYGTFFLNGRNERTHRVSWMIVFGEIPTGLCVLHKCDNTLCVRPDHLFIGSKSDNNRDRHLKGRTAKGSKIHRAILSDQDASYIRRIYKKNSRVSGSVALSKRFGISHQGVLSVVNRETWKHVA